jgi:hypothetical protein
MTTYRQRLEAEYSRLRTRRVNLRRCLEWLQYNIVGDPTETVRLRNEACLDLQFTNRPWEEICHKLGRDPHPAPVSLRITARDREALARQGARTVTRATARPTVRNVGYITKVMVPGR